MSTLLEMIRATVTENPNDHTLICIPYATISYRNSINKTHAFSPYKLIFGYTNSRPPRNQEQLISKYKYVREIKQYFSFHHKTARERTIPKNLPSKNYFDDKHKPKERHFEINDLVFIKASLIKDKLSNKLNGPFLIIQT